VSTGKKRENEVLSVKKGGGLGFKKAFCAGGGKSKWCFTRKGGIRSKGREKGKFRSK